MGFKREIFGLAAAAGLGLAADRAAAETPSAEQLTPRSPETAQQQARMDRAFMEEAMDDFDSAGQEISPELAQRLLQRHLKALEKRFGTQEEIKAHWEELLNRKYKAGLSKGQRLELIIQLEEATEPAEIERISEELYNPDITEAERGQIDEQIHALAQQLEQLLLVQRMIDGSSSIEQGYLQMLDSIYPGESF